MPVTRIGVQAVTGSPGQNVDIDPARITATIANVGGVAVEYSTGSTWTTIAAGATSASVSCNTADLRLRRAVSGAYPVAVDINWTATSEGESNSLTASQAQSLVSGDGIPPADYRTTLEQALTSATRLKVVTAAPTVPETAPTNKSSGGSWFIDKIGGANGNAGNAPTAPWADAWKLPGGGAANGGTIFLAADCVWEYASTWTDYKAGRVDGTNSFAANNIGAWTSAAATPTIVRPYYPRGVANSKPTIRWFALMQASDWTQEVGISGGKVWSAAWAKAGNSYQNVCVAFGMTRSPGVAWNQQNTSGAPANLVAGGQFAVDANKVYVYVPDGSNPVTYYGEVRVFGGNGQALYTSFNGLAQNVLFIDIRFEMCMPAWIFSTGNTNNNDVVTFSDCEFVKTTPLQAKNQQSFASPTEQSITVDSCYFEDLPSAGFKVQSTAGTAGNTNSWEFSRNRINRAGLSACYGGALYIQCTAGTKHIAWGNYFYDCRNGTAGEPIDGCGGYADVGTDKAIFQGNVFERCGKGIQTNSMSGMATVVGNMFIDCGSIGSLTNTTGDLKAPSCVVNHNTYLWTGRISFSALNAGPNIGGTGVKNWAFEPVIEITNSQANSTGNAAYNFGSVTVANNAIANCSGAQLADKKAIRIPETWTTNLLVAGNAPCGMATAAVTGVNSGTDFTNTAKYCHVIGSAADAVNWFGQGALGVGRPTPGSLLVGAGAALSLQYQDIGGRNFAPVPTIGCYEVNA